MNDNQCVIAADVGGTNLRVAIVDSSGEVLRQTEVFTPKSGTAEDLIDAIVGQAESLLFQSTGERPIAFGLAIAALVDPSSGAIYASPNLPQLNGLKIAQWISTRLGIRVIVENDATAAAIGEHWLGAGKGVDHLICLTLGTGVGGGLILNGQPHRGIGGTGGELGHICVEPDGHPCGCGSRGCLEQYASATAIVRIATELLGARESKLREIAAFSARDVYNAAVDGDPVACETFGIMGRYLGSAMADLINVLNPQIVVIAGGGAGSWDKFIDHTWTEIRQRAFADPVAAVKIVPAALGSEAGLLGAARVALFHASCS